MKTDTIEDVTDALERQIADIRMRATAELSGCYDWLDDVYRYERDRLEDEREQGSNEWRTLEDLHAINARRIVRLMRLIDRIRP